ncbi:MAG: DUF1761 family protein [Bacteroidetes bacterium]|jgi:hypothetical protein|nr:DUF1761 family protein [Bacteroidota bacterium]
MMELISSLNWLAVVLASVVYFILGALWYSPLMFSNPWMKVQGKTPDDFNDPNPVIYLYSFVLQFLGVASLALFMSAMGIDTLLNGAIVGFGAGAGLVFTLSGATGLFMYENLGLHFINNGYHVAGLTVAGLVLGWF